MQSLLERIPEGEALAKSMAERLADNQKRFGYDEAVFRSLKMEVRALTVSFKDSAVFDLHARIDDDR